MTHLRRTSLLCAGLLLLVLIAAGGCRVAELPTDGFDMCLVGSDCDGEAECRVVGGVRECVPATANGEGEGEPEDEPQPGEGEGEGG